MLSPTVWLGVVIGGIGVALIVGSGMMRSRRLGTGDGATRALPSADTRDRGSRRSAVTDTDPEMAEIEAILRKRGIT